MEHVIEKLIPQLTNFPSYNVMLKVEAIRQIILNELDSGEYSYDEIFEKIEEIMEAK